MQDLTAIVFATALGLTVSGVIANLYGLTPRRDSRSAVYWAVMVLAGPNLMLDNSTRSFLKHTTPLRIWIPAVMIGLYWSFVIGLAALNLWIKV